MSVLLCYKRGIVHRGVVLSGSRELFLTREMASSSQSRYERIWRISSSGREERVSVPTLATVAGVVAVIATERCP